MIRNTVSLAQMRELSARQVSDLPIGQLANLFEEMAEMKADASKLADKLSDALNMKFRDGAADLRRADNKDSGRVSFDDGDYVVRADLPKKVTWDQIALTRAVQVIRDEWHEKPADYVTLKVEVSETKYNAWPPAIQTLFHNARTVGTGKPSYVIERRAV